MVTVPVAAGPVAGLPFQEMATAVGKPDPPKTKSEAQAVLRHFGFKGMSISGIDVGGETDDEIARVYALTGPVLQEDGEMRREAKTVVILADGENVRARHFDGWRVVDPGVEARDRERLEGARKYR